MAQQTNLNVSPYFDDFDPNDNYHKVLFKPGFPVQARELSGLQSILQNQIEKFGQHFFKEGAKVIPGNTAYSTDYFAVELNNSHLGVPVEFYIDQLIDRKIIGASTGSSGCTISHNLVTSVYFTAGCGVDGESKTKDQLSGQSGHPQIKGSIWRLAEKRE